MLKSLCILPLVGAMCLVGCNATPMSRDHDHDDEHDTEQVMQLDQVPASVRATIQKEAATGSIDKIDMNRKNGRVVYDADIIIDHRLYDLEVASDGKLLEKRLASEHDKHGQEDKD